MVWNETQTQAPSFTTTSSRSPSSSSVSTRLVASLGFVAINAISFGFGYIACVVSTPLVRHAVVSTTRIVVLLHVFTFCILLLRADVDMPLDEYFSAVLAGSSSKDVKGITNIGLAIAGIFFQSGYSASLFRDMWWLYILHESPHKKTAVRIATAAILVFYGCMIFLVLHPTATEFMNAAALFLLFIAFIAFYSKTSQVLTSRYILPLTQPDNTMLTMERRTNGTTKTRLVTVLIFVCCVTFLVILQSTFGWGAVVTTKLLKENSAAKVFS